MIKNLFLTSIKSLSTSFIGNVSSNRDDTRVNGEIMFSFQYGNNAKKVADNEHTQQTNDTFTNHLHMALYEHDSQQIQDMNFTLISTLQATTSMPSENITVTTERSKEFRLSNDLGNVSLAISKVRSTFKVTDMLVALFIFISNPRYYLASHQRQVIRRERQSKMTKSINSIFMR